ncbi:MAG: hypothetical protein A3B75_00180 [Candidatus Terrybacteria bacterium RIFCSPHIGHO2_02_FULL_43_14]|nr:MAG: hypothetical protein A3B75_00180 [Candidatus Terrybacteria bacterium RIFCSPHIGHO2_02_FULL_43_14]
MKWSRRVLWKAPLTLRVEAVFLLLNDSYVFFFLILREPGPEGERNTRINLVLIQREQKII